MVRGEEKYSRVNQLPPFQMTDGESKAIGGQVVVMMMPVSDTCVRFMTHCDVKKEDVKVVIKKLRHVIQEYDNMMYLEYKIGV